MALYFDIKFFLYKTAAQNPVGESTVYETAALLPQSQFTFIEKCGHLPWLEEETVVAEFYKLLDWALKK